MFQQRDAAYLTLKAESFEHEAKLDDSRIKAYYDENIDRFKTEQKVSIEYLELNAATVAKSITVDEEALLNYYEQRKDDYLVQDDAAQRKLLTDIAARVKKGESFAALAKEYSEDVGSAENGGDIGFIGRAVMDKSFEDAMFALKEGKVSGVVKSSLGLHLIQVEEIKGEERHVRHILLNLDKQKLRSRSYEEVRNQIEADFKRSRAEKIFNDKYDQLNNLSFEHPQTLTIAAEELGMTLQHSEPFAVGGGTGITAIPAVFNAAFSDNVLNQGNNSELLDLGGERIVVLRIKENMPAAARPLEEVNEQIITLLLKEAGAERARSVGDAILGKLREGANPQTLAKEYMAEWQTTKSYSRESKGIVPSVLSTVFAMPRPAADKATFTTASLPNGDYTVIGLYAVKDGDPATRTAEERLAAARRISAADAGSAVSLLRKDLRAKAKVTIYEKNL
jgi:peptidyl-prolyl cis-trans isomerase D